MDPIKKSYVQAMRDFFGMKPGQTLVEFSQELKDIKGDRAYFIDGLKMNGIEVIENAVTVAQ